MASAAEQLAANINFSSFAKAKELRERLLFTLGALIVFRLGTFIPLPGVDIDAFSRAFQTNFGGGGVFGMFNMFAGGAVERMAIFALNIMPYISASIIMRLMTTVSPNLEKLQKDGEGGRKQINQYTRYLCVVLAAVQAYAIASGIEGNFALNPGITFKLSVVITLVGGTMFLLWLGEQITARGVGNGISLIIFAGIVAELPRTIAQFMSLGRTGAMPGYVLLGIAALLIASLFFIVFMERAQRRLIVQYPKRQAGNRMFGGETSHLPLKLNTAGVIPPIFASSLLLLPMTMAGFQGGGGPEWLSTLMIFLGRGQPIYMALYAILIIFFCFFYTAIVFNPDDTADNLKKYGGFIPGIRPGKRTAEYIDYVLTRLTAVGALYITAVCLLPEFIYGTYALSLAFGGTSLLIVVTVTMDTVAQIQSHLLAHQYEGLIKKARLRGSKR